MLNVILIIISYFLIILSSILSSLVFFSSNCMLLLRISSRLKSNVDERRKFPIFFSFFHSLGCIILRFVNWPSLFFCFLFSLSLGFLGICFTNSSSSDRFFNSLFSWPLGCCETFFTNSNSSFGCTGTFL